MNSNKHLYKYIADILKRIPNLMIGFFIISIGIQLMIDTNLGLSPWGIFHSGLSNTFGITFGTAQQLTGLGIVLISMFLKIFPGIGTILNMYFIGFFIKFIDKMNFLPIYDSLLTNIFVFLIGNFLFCFGVFFYLKADLGSGPRDSLMLSFTKLTRFTAGQVKVTIEISAAIIGFLLGGSIGLGTGIAAITGGLFLDFIFKVFKYNPKSRTFTNLIVNYKEIKAIIEYEI